MMQLILEAEPSGDIDTMSMDVGTPVNGVITELKNVKNDINIPEIITSETELNPDIIKEAVLEADDILEKVAVNGVTEENNDEIDSISQKSIEDVKSDVDLQTEKKSTDIQIPKFSAVTNSEANIEITIEDESDAMAEKETHTKTDIETSNNDISMESNLEDTQISSAKATSDKKHEEIETTINVDMNTNLLENMEQSETAPDVVEIKEDNVLCMESPLESFTTNGVKEISGNDIDDVISKESNALEIYCAEDNNVNKVKEVEMEMSNDVENIDMVDLEEDASNKKNVIPTSDNIPDDNIDNSDQNQSYSDNNASEKIANGNAVLDITKNEKIKEPINIILENDNVLTSEEKQLEHVIMDDEEKIETANPVQEIDINGTEKDLDAALGENSSVEEVSPEINNLLDGLTENTETVSNQIELTSDSDNKETNDKCKDDVISNDNDITGVKASNLGMDIDMPEVSDIIENAYENKTVTVSDIPLDNVAELNDTKEVLEHDIKKDQENKTSIDVDLGNSVNDNSKKDIADENKLDTTTDENVEIIDDDIKIIEDDDASKTKELEETKTLPIVCKLSNTLDILSDDEDEAPKVDQKKNDAPEKQCIDIDDDDDIMFIEDDSSNSKEPTESEHEKEIKAEDAPTAPTAKADLETGEKETTSIDMTENTKTDEMDITDTSKIDEKAEPAVEKIVENEEKSEKDEKPLLPEKFLKTAKKNLGEMTRDELEDFCIMKIVESLVDRSGLGEIKNKMKVMARSLEEYRKKAMLLTKQNRDLQVVLKSVQEEQKKRANVIQPLKITRSVGMQVLMTDKPNPRRLGPIPSQSSTRPLRSTTQNKNSNNTNNTNSTNKPGAIPFPRLVPANNAANKSPINSPAKITSPNGIRTPSPALPKAPEKRPQSRMQSSSAVTVDLTDDEPPAKINKAKAGPLPPVRLVPSQNLMQPKGQSFQNNNSNNTPRKVYIPISGPQQQAIQQVMMKSVPTATTPGPRPRLPAAPVARTPASTFKVQDKLRHPAPLPEAVKQYTPVTWKALPPAPDLKLSKVENGIVISWKIDGIPETAYETVASYQLYAYQETSSPPSTALWKKIGDVKALPLPMACTLTQFMAGFKYYFAVRAVDIRSRLGPFSVPGSILLLSKV